MELAASRPWSRSAQEAVLADRLPASAATVAQRSPTKTGREAWTELDVLSKETKPRRSIYQAFKRFPCIGIVDEPDWNDPDTGATEAGKSTPQAPAPGNDKVRASAQHTKRPARDHTPRDQEESKT